MTAPPVEFQARYDEDAPGPYCLSHRSVYCGHAQALIEGRTDAERIAEVIGGSIRNGRLDGEKFYIALPIYPELCLWDVLTYRAVFHETFGPMAELEGKVHERHKVVHRILPGESAADLAMSLRQNFEDDETVHDSVELLRTMQVRPGQPLPIPRCTSTAHSMKYQQHINQVLNPNALKHMWDELRSQVYGMMWTFHYHRQCVFCWTKRNASDAIRVAPDFAVDPTDDGDFSDLVPSPAPGRSDPPDWTS